MSDASKRAACTRVLWHIDQETTADAIGIHHRERLVKKDARGGLSIDRYLKFPPPGAMQVVVIVAALRLLEDIGRLTHETRKGVSYWTRNTDDRPA